MIQAVLAVWIASAVFIIRERRIVRLVIKLGVFSLLTSVCIMLLSAPDVAMAETVINAFFTIIFVVGFEKYYNVVGSSQPKKKKKIKYNVVPFIFTAAVAALFIYFIPEHSAPSVLKDEYMAHFKTDIGGENAVTAIYLGYRMYDTLFEALMLLASVMAVLHLSAHKDTYLTFGEHSEIKGSEVASVTIRIICPILLLFGIYLVANGHISPGGGFQGGVVAASFMVCRYLIHDIYDSRVDKLLTTEKIIFIAILLLTLCFIVHGLNDRVPIPRYVYLLAMNAMIGVKVFCGFFIVFYRFIVFERK